ncbi:DUF1508 domain-containing protein [Clostridium botulinum]
MPSEDKWQFYKNSDGKLRLRRTACNGRIVGASDEEYVNRLDCIGNAKRHGYKG